MCHQRYHYVYYVDLGIISYKDAVLWIALIFMFFNTVLHILQFIIHLF
jgi:hypothetical protein